MKRVFIIHRWSGSPNDDWRPWLKQELENRNYEVVVPEMPDTDTPMIEKWVERIKKIVGIPDEEVLFIGHSIGCQAILRYLEIIQEPIFGAIFVAGWSKLENLEDKETEEIARPWLETPINLDKVKKVLPQSALLISDNDPYGAFEENKTYFSRLGSRIIVLHHAGHITGEDGFRKLEQIFEPGTIIIKN
jgi:predicted alpha/beta hydrolase family esterase